MGKTLRVLLWIAGIAAVVIGLARAFAIRWWRIPADDVYLATSVTPSLHAGDLILLWRLTSPGRGDLVLCPEPKHPERIVIGRIVAEGGENVKVDGTRVYVDDEVLKVESNCKEGTFRVADPQTGIMHEQSCSLEVLGGRTHMRGAATGPTVPLPVEAAVVEGQVYLVSDNRLFPYDSRDYGPVDRETCKETVFFRISGSKGLGDAESRFTFIR